jgi:hypothetical protein
VRPAAPVVAALWRAVLSALLVLAAACGVAPTAPADGRAGDPVDNVDVRAMNGDERTAVSATDTFWRNHFRELFGRAYRSPGVEGGYLGRNGPRCAGEPPVPFNAFYCPPEDFLAWDQNLMAAGYR